MNNLRIGITERIDAGLDQRWRKLVDDFTAVILITKAPQLLADKDIPSNAIVHCTITGMGGTIIEPHVAPTAITLPAYRQIVKRIGSDRCVLRIDPVVPTAKGIKTALAVAKEGLGRIRVSFLDMYPHVKERFNASNVPLPYSTFHASLQTRLNALAQFPTHTEVCGEPDIACSGCVSQLDLDALKIEFAPHGTSARQRKDCPCLAEKQELMGNIQRMPCAHQCLYCYWKS